MPPILTTHPYCRSNREAITVDVDAIHRWGVDHPDVPQFRFPGAPAQDVVLFGADGTESQCEHLISVSVAADLERETDLGWERVSSLLVDIAPPGLLGPDPSKPTGLHIFVWGYCSERESEHRPAAPNHTEWIEKQIIVDDQSGEEWWVNMCGQVMFAMNPADYLKEAEELMLKMQPA